MKVKVIIYILLLLITLNFVYSCFSTKFILKKKNFPLNPIVYKNFLNEEEINLLLNSCNDFGNSTIINNGKIVSNYRTSKTCFIPLNHKIYNIISKKIKNEFNIDNNLEALQLTKYYKDDYYKEHHDYFDPNKENQKNTLKNNGQRMKTIFVYLKEPEEGGETEFPILRKKFIPSKGDAILWTNCLKKDNKYILRKETLHSGSVVKKGIKIGLNIWLLDK